MGTDTALKAVSVSIARVQLLCWIRAKRFPVADGECSRVQQRSVDSNQKESFSPFKTEMVDVLAWWHSHLEKCLFQCVAWGPKLPAKWFGLSLILQVAGDDFHGTFLWKWQSCRKGSEHNLFWYFPFAVQNPTPHFLAVQRPPRTAAIWMDSTCRQGTRMALGALSLRLKILWQTACHEAVFSSSTTQVAILRAICQILDKPSFYRSFISFLDGRSKPGMVRFEASRIFTLAILQFWKDTLIPVFFETLKRFLWLNLQCASRFYYSGSVIVKSLALAVRQADFVFPLVWH